MVSKLAVPPTPNEVISKINEIIDDKQDTISDLSTIRSGATGNVKLNGGSSSQTISLTSGTGTTALAVKSMSTSSYLSFSGSSGWLASFGIGSDKKPTIYDGTSHTIAYVSDIPTNNNQLTNGAGYITGIPYGESTSAKDATQKEVTISEITSLNTGQIIIVKPTITSTVADATLKLNNFTAYPILYGAAAVTTSTDSITWAANYPSWFRFDGSHWVFLGHGVDNNTTYSSMSVSEGTTGTATTSRVVRADYLKSIILGTKLTGLSTSTNSAVAATDTALVGIGKLQAQVNAKQNSITSSNKLSASLVSGLATVATSGSYNDLSNKPTIPTVNNATLTIQENGSSVATFTANASSNVTANISVPNVTSTYTATGTDAVNGVAVSNAIATKQDNLVSGTNIKTINGTSLLGSGNITIETSSTPNVDGTTISYNSSDALQTIAVKNKRDGSTLPIWHGTAYQWNHGEPTTWYYWQTSISALWQSTTLPSSGAWLEPSFGNGNFVTIASSGTNSDKAAYSTDGGATWQSATLPSSARWVAPVFGTNRFVTISSFVSNASAYSTDGGATWSSGGKLPSFASWTKPAYGNGNFVTFSVSTNKAAYSINEGSSWTSVTLDDSGAWQYPAFGNGNFVNVINDSDKAAYSTDGGATWHSATLPSSAKWQSPVFCNGNFVTVANNSDKAAYSTDGGATWQSATLPSSASWQRMAVGNNNIIVLANVSTKAAYSTDGGATWHSASLLSSSGTMNWTNPAFGDGKFIAVTSSGNTSVYSTDGGATWSMVSMPSSGSWRSPAYGNGRFVTVKSSSTESAIFAIQYAKCYTDTPSPTTSSTVYSAPAVASSYTISSVASGAITLSDNNTYYYNQSGNASTYQTIGDAHPDYLCFIDEVGVKIGNTMIATNNSNS